MRHLKRSCKLGRNTSHRRCLFANMCKSLIDNGRIETTIAKAKELRRYADRLITMAKEGTLASRRRAIAALMIRFNSLTSEEVKAAKEGNTYAYNGDRRIMEKLFGELAGRFAERNGGYTRIIKTSHRRVGDSAQTCLIEFLAE